MTGTANASSAHDLPARPAAVITKPVAEPEHEVADIVMADADHGPISSLEAKRRRKEERSKRDKKYQENENGKEPKKKDEKDRKEKKKDKSKHLYFSIILVVLIPG